MNSETESEARTQRRVALFGSTGSIGRNTLEVAAAAPHLFQIEVLTAHSQLPLLVEQARKFKPSVVVAACERRAREFDWSGLPPGCRLLTGEEGLAEAARLPQVDVVVAAIVGAAGLTSTWAAVDAGKRVALANKETLVMAGQLVMDLARRRGAEILPVDSEHSAIFQALAAGKRDEVRRIVLTASGGPFRHHTAEQLAEVSVKEALAHPTWEMGAKITVDSATMMNKALEIIEARWLFEMPAERIEVVIHPQSIVHSLVEYLDGSVIAQLGPPDMRLPIQYALTYPERIPCPGPKLDWRRSWQLRFEPPDTERFPALLLGARAAREGGTTGAVLNAANEAAVAAFLEGKIRYCDIEPACRSVLENHQFEAHPELARLLALDAWARQEVHTWIASS